MADISEQPRNYLPSLALSLLSIAAMTVILSVLGTLGAARDFSGYYPGQLESLLRGGCSDSIKVRDEDANCPFRYSSLYRSVYVYPTYNNTSESPLLSERGRSGALLPWPWLEVDSRVRPEGSGHYEVGGQMAQYTLELIVRDIITHPRSCLRAHDPEDAKLFYIPYLPSTEFHAGRMYPTQESYATTPYAKAVYDAIEGDYRGWENDFGLTSKYWQRRSGADHILVFSEPLHGLSHPRNRRGHHHYIHTQRQLRPPIVISVELSTSFVRQYPKCSAKNIVSPYPNPDGRWFNGQFEAQAIQIRRNSFDDIMKSNAAHPAEKEIAKSMSTMDLGYQHNATVSFVRPRPLAHYYSAGRHGTCRGLRVSLINDLKCSPSFHALQKAGKGADRFHIAMRFATFCPCPGGDSPGAKRMFDAILAGCIPIVMSEDFVWPFSRETDGRNPRTPSDYSLRWNSTDWEDRRLDDECKRVPLANDGGFREAMEGISLGEIQRLRRGLKKAANFYAYYRTEKKLPNNPLQARILPEGGAAHEIVKALAERASGQRWAACEAEIMNFTRGRNEPKQFLC